MLKSPSMRYCNPVCGEGGPIRRQTALTAAIAAKSPDEIERRTHDAEIA